MRCRILRFTLRDVSIPQQFVPIAAKFSPERKLRSFGTIFNKDSLASTRRFKRGPQGIRDEHASAFLTLWEETQGSSVNNLSREYAVECLPTAFSAIKNVRLFMEVCSRGGPDIFFQCFRLSRTLSDKPYRNSVRKKWVWLDERMLKKSILSISSPVWLPAFGRG